MRSKPGLGRIAQLPVRRRGILPPNRAFARRRQRQLPFTAEPGESRLAQPSSTILESAGRQLKAKPSVAKMTHTNCKLGGVQNEGIFVGYSFVVRGDQNKVLFALAYSTQAKAKAAHELMAQVLEGADVTVAYAVRGPGR